MVINAICPGFMNAEGLARRHWGELCVFVLLELFLFVRYFMRQWSFPRLAADFFGGLDDAVGVGGLRGSVPDVFEQDYTCYSVSFAGREQLERGNKILLPPSALNTLARMNVSWPMLFSLANPTLQRSTHSGVLEFSAPEGTCYMPYWMMRNLLLSEGDQVHVVNTALPKGTYVKLQPLTSDFLDIWDHRAVLEHTLSHFAALTVGDTIVIQHNDQSYEIEITECKPGPAVSIIETDIQVDFAPPKDYIPPNRNVSSAAEEDIAMNPASPTLSDERGALGGASQASSPPVSSQQRGPKDSTKPFKLFGGTGTRLNGRHAEQSSPTTSSEPAASLTGAGNGDQSLRLAKRIPGGVRVACGEYEKLCRSGKIPRSSQTAHALLCSDTRNSEDRSSLSQTAFTLFGGRGYTCVRNEH